jgi:hypothetical protein
MNHPRNRIILGAGIAAALAAPVAAQAKGPHGHGHEHAAPVAHQHGHHAVRGGNVIAYGTVDGVDGNVVTLTVGHGNHAARGLKGQQLQVDVSSARIRVRDVNGDGKRDVADVAAGDRVQVQLRIPRGTTDLSQPFAARRLLDKGPAPTQTDTGADDGADSTDA